MPGDSPAHSFGLSLAKNALEPALIVSVPVSSCTTAIPRSARARTLSKMSTLRCPPGVTSLRVRMPGLGIRSNELPTTLTSVSPEPLAQIDRPDPYVSSSHAHRATRHTELL